MNVLHVTTGIDPASGGPTRSVKGLCRALSQNGVSVSLLVLRGHHIFENPCGVEVIYNEIPNIRRYDLVHIHGLWGLGLHLVAKKCRAEGIEYVVSPRGMLDPWALSIKKLKKRLAFFLYQRKDLLAATAFHATAPEEAAHIKTAGFFQPCIVAPNAVDLPRALPKTHSSEKTKTALFLSRLHPGKGLLSLADAWATVHPSGWRMKVVGPDSYGHKREVVKKLEKLGILDEWCFADALDDVQKWDAYRSAHLLVHPSVSENFGITIAEALWAGLPVITTKGTPWQELEGRKCGWWIDIGVAPLARALKEAMALTDEERHEMGTRGRKLVEEKYTWDAVVKVVVNGYEEILNGRT